MQPNSAALPNQPTSIFVSENCFSTNSTVPDMTAVSNPNRKPPRDATKHIQVRNIRLPLSDMTGRAGVAAEEGKAAMAVSPDLWRKAERGSECLKISLFLHTYNCSFQRFHIPSLTSD